RPFDAGRQGEDRERAEERLRVVAPAEEVDGALEAVARDASLEVRALGPLAREDEDRRGARRLPAHAEPGERLDDDVVSLVPLEAADAADDRRVGGEAEGGAEAAVVRARAEAGGVDAVQDDADRRARRDDLLPAQVVGERLRDGDDHVGPARRAGVEEAAAPRVGLGAAVVRVDDERDAGGARRPGGLEPDAAMGVDDVGPDRPDPLDQGARPDDRVAGLRSEEVERRMAVEPLGEAPEVLEAEDVDVEAGPVGTADDVGEEALHPAVVDVLDHVEHADPGGRGVAGSGREESGAAGGFDHACASACRGFAEAATVSTASRRRRASMSQWKRCSTALRPARAQRRRRSGSASRVRAWARDAGSLARAISPHPVSVTMRRTGAMSDAGTASPA